MKHVVIAGASGLLGSNLLTILTEMQEVAVTSLVRKINEDNPSIPSLTEVLFNFDNVDDYKKIGTDIPCDIFFCCLGTTLRKAKSFENFMKVDRDYPIQFIEYFRKNSPNTLFVFTSSIGVSNPRGYYLNAKCEVEKALTKSLLKYIIVRPSILLGKRKEFRIAEKIGGVVLHKVDELIKKFNISENFSISKYAPIEASQVAKVMAHQAINFDKVLPGMVLEGEDLKFSS